MLSSVDSIMIELIFSVDRNYIVSAFFSIYSIEMKLLSSVDSIGMALLFSVASN